MVSKYGEMKGNQVILMRQPATSSCEKTPAELLGNGS